MYLAVTGKFDPGRKLMMPEDAIEFYEQNSAMRAEGRTVVPGTM